VWWSPGLGRITPPRPRQKPQRRRFASGEYRLEGRWQSGPRPRVRAEGRCGGGTWPPATPSARRSRPARVRHGRGGVQPQWQAAGQRLRRRHGAAVEPGHWPPRRQHARCARCGRRWPGRSQVTARPAAALLSHADLGPPWPVGIPSPGLPVPSALCGVLDVVFPPSRGMPLPCADVILGVGGRETAGAPGPGPSGARRCRR